MWFKKRYLVILATGYTLVAFCLFDLPYANRRPFLSPLPEESGILIRNDRWGKGHFGARRKNNKIHQAVDLEASVKTPVYAPLSGKIIKLGHNPTAGNYVKIYHPPGMTTYYCHLDSVLLIEGERVKQNQQIGSVGKTGNANTPDIKPHLHFEVCLNGIPQNPLNYIHPPIEE